MIAKYWKSSSKSIRPIYFETIHFARVERIVFKHMKPKMTKVSKEHRKNSIINSIAIYFKIWIENCDTFCTWQTEMVRKNLSSISNRKRWCSLRSISTESKFFKEQWCNCWGARFQIHYSPGQKISVAPWSTQPFPIPMSTIEVSTRN